MGLRACVLAAMLAAPLPARAVQQNAVFEASRAIMDGYNADDAERVRDALAEGARRTNSLDDVRRVLRICRAAVGGPIRRLSLPVSGTRHYGFLEAYTDHDRADMLVEVDERGKVVFWTLSKDILAKDLTCSLRYDGRRPRPEAE